MQIVFEDQSREEIKRQVIVIEDRLYETHQIRKDITKDSSVDRGSPLEVITTGIEIATMSMQINLKCPMTVARNAARVLEETVKKAITLRSTTDTAAKLYEQIP